MLIAAIFVDTWGFKEGAKLAAVGVEGGLLVLTGLEAALDVGASRPDTSRALDAQHDALPQRNLA
jgi:hypothetical protein